MAWAWQAVGAGRILQFASLSLPLIVALADVGPRRLRRRAGSSGPGARGVRRRRPRKCVVPSAPPGPAALAKAGPAGGQMDAQTPPRLAVRVSRQLLRRWCRV